MKNMIRSLFMQPRAVFAKVFLCIAIFSLPVMEMTATAASVKAPPPITWGDVGKYFSIFYGVSPAAAVLWSLHQGWTMEVIVNLPRQEPVIQTVAEIEALHEELEAMGIE